jgi:hypothetical protein
MFGALVIALSYRDGERRRSLFETPVAVQWIQRNLKERQMD